MIQVRPLAGRNNPGEAAPCVFITDRAELAPNRSLYPRISRPDV